MAGASQTGDRAASRRPADIEQEIEAIRARLEATLHELEERLSPDRLVSSASHAFRDATVPGPLFDDMLDAARRNPVPLLLIGAGVAWIAYDLLRNQREPAPLRPAAPDSAAVALVADLVGIARQGTRTLRQAGMHLPDGPARLLLREAAEERGLTAAVLQAELQRLAGETVHGDAPGGIVLAGWKRVQEVMSSGPDTALPQAVAAAEAETEQHFRAALAHDLPGDLRLIVAARLTEVQRTRARLDALHGRTTPSMAEQAA